VKFSNEIKAGLITILSISILVVGYNYLNGRNLFKKERYFIVKHKDIDGLKEGDPILINGYSIGRVDEITLQNSGDLILKYSIQNKITIPDNSVFTIASLDLLGAKGVILSLGNSENPAEPGDTLKGNIEKSLGETVNEQVKPVKQKAEKLLSSIDTLISTLQSIVNPQFTKDLKQSVASINTSLHNFQDNIDKLNKITNNVESVTSNLNSNNESINKIITNTRAFSDSLASSDIKTTIENTNKTMKEFSMIAEKVNNGEGSLGLLLSDKNLYHNLSESSSNLESLLYDLQSNPKRYVSFSLFGRKNKPSTPREDTSHKH
jgi:phospholipid/cholesterol/gamma-HCH transport system substrate-binding protein